MSCKQSFTAPVHQGAELGEDEVAARAACALEVHMSEDLAAVDLQGT
jgi:hypothetical protein